MEDDVAEELASLKAKLEKLEQARSQRETPTPQAIDDPQIASLATENVLADDNSWMDDLESLEPEQILERLKEGLGEWFDELNNELKDTKPSTLLTIFGLGVLVGKLTN